ncbi:MAG TPA: DUF5668 domain-containing protein [Candidatus Acidoferrales bacterium]|nr:DUF5668 domain-containing protein [Candidatus Acidoferrales bacterium]
MLREHSSNRGFAVGLIILAVGVALLLDQLGYVEAERILRFWPLIVVAWGVDRLTCANPHSRFWGGFLILLGGVLQLEELGYQRVRIETVWPVFIIWAGVMLIFRSSWWPSVQPPRSDNRTFEADPPRRAEPPPPSTQANFSNESWTNAWGHHDAHSSPESRVNLVRIFSGARWRIVSKDFTGGEIVTIFGGFRLDLRDADLRGNQARIDAVSVFGGGEILVPPNWTVVSRGVGIFGGYENRTTAPLQPGAGGSSETKKLVVTGAAIFGGIVIGN